MAVLWANTDFEGGTNGANVTSSNSPFTSVLPSGQVTFSNAHVLSPGGGTLAAKCAASASAPFMTMSGTTNMWTSATKIYYRFYWYNEVMVSATSTLLEFKNVSQTTGILAESPRILTTGAVQIRNAAATQVAVSATGLVSAGNFYRFEGMIDVTNAQQQIKVFAGANANGATADYDSGVVASSMSTFTGVDTFQIGYNNSCTATGHFDNIQVNDATSGWVGSIAGGGNAKVWNGTAFVAKPAKVWNGTAWVQKPVKKWNGTAWVVTSY